jgi:hypothetical protein
MGAATGGLHKSGRATPSGKKMATTRRGLRKKDTEMPPIERVQGPDIKGMRHCASPHKASTLVEVNENRQEKPIETIV